MSCNRQTSVHIFPAAAGADCTVELPLKIVIIEKYTIILWVNQFVDNLSKIVNRVQLPNAQGDKNKWHPWEAETKENFENEEFVVYN